MNWHTEEMAKELVRRHYDNLMKASVQVSPLLKLFASERKRLTRWQRFKNRLRWYEIRYRVRGAWHILRHGDDE